MPPSQGEIYYASAGNDHSRPVLVVSRAELNRGLYAVVVPFTSKNLEVRRDLTQCVAFESGEYGLFKDCVAQADQIAFIPIADLDVAAGPIGKLDGERLEEILEAIKYVLAIE